MNLPVSVAFCLFWQVLVSFSQFRSVSVSFGQFRSFSILIIFKGLVGFGRFRLNSVGLGRLGFFRSSLINFDRFWIWSVPDDSIQISKSAKIQTLIRQKQMNIYHCKIHPEKVLKGHDILHLASL